MRVGGGLVVVAHAVASAAVAATKGGRVGPRAQLKPGQFP